MRSSFAGPLAALPVTTLLFMLAGCSGQITDPHAILASRTPPAPTSIAPITPRLLLDEFARTWNQRDADRYTELFTNDYRFVFSPFDSAGAAFADRSLDREDELQIAEHLFVTGTSSEPRALRIVLTFDRTFIPEPDSRPGKTYPWHQEIKRNVVLSVDTVDQSFRITGTARFFVVRGDSAAIPPDLVARGFRPDPNRWWIERWEDGTLDFGGGTPATGSTPTQSRSWGALKLLYW